MEHFENIDRRHTLMTSFAVVRDEKVIYINQRDLLERKIIGKKLKQKAKAVVVSIKEAERMRKRA